jgi:hypothetical protein
MSKLSNHRKYRKKPQKIQKETTENTESNHRKYRKKLQKIQKVNHRKYRKKPQKTQKNLYLFYLRKKVYCTYIFNYLSF